MQCKVLFCHKTLGYLRLHGDRVLSTRTEGQNTGAGQSGERFGGERFGDDRG